MHSAHWRHARRFARTLSPRARVALTAAAGLALIVALDRSGAASSDALAQAQSWIAAGHGNSSPAAVHGIRDQSPLATAFAATLGSPTGVMLRVGPAQEATWFTPAALIRAPFGPVLISEGEVVAPHAESTGKLAIAYLAGAGARLRPRALFVPAIESGSLGRLEEWSVRTDLGRWPVVQVEGEAEWDGDRCSWTTLLELQPRRPVELATIPLSYEDAASASRIAGRVERGPSAGTVDVRYSGTADFTDHYVRRGDRFALDGGAPSRMRTC